MNWRLSLYSVLMQALGPLSLFILSLEIVRNEGASAQGEFASARAMVDLIVAMGLFGLPQSIVLMINRNNYSRRILYINSIHYGLCCLAFGMAISVAFHLVGSGQLPPTLVVASTSLVIIGIIRSIVLTMDKGLVFNFITVLPTLILVAITSCVMMANLPLTRSLNFTFAATGVISLLICLGIAHLVLLKSVDTRVKPEYSKIFIQGVDAFIISICGSLQIYVCYKILESTSGAAEVGFLSIAMLILNGVTFPMQAISPLLLNRWSKEISSEAIAKINHAINMVAGILLLMSIICVIVGIFLTPMISAKKEAPPPELWCLLFSLAPMFIARVNMLRLASNGQYRFNSKLIMIQFLVFVSISVGLIHAALLKPLTAIVAVWVFADFLTAAIVTLKLRRDAKLSVRGAN